MYESYHFQFLIIQEVVKKSTFQKYGVDTWKEKRNGMEERKLGMLIKDHDTLSYASFHCYWSGRRYDHGILRYIT